MLEFLQKLDETVLRGIHQGWRCSAADSVLCWITESSHFILPLALAWILLLVLGGRTGRVLALLLAVCLLVTDQVSSHLIKPWVGRDRPCFGVVEGVTALVDQVRSRSFPSSHASNVFGAATLLSLARGRWWLWSFLLAALVGVSRIYVGVHYPSDVLAGAVLGIFIGWVIWRVARWSGLLESGAPDGNASGSR